MRTVWLIRHAESIGNAGEPTEHAATIPLSALGQRQAAALATAFPSAPDLIVTSRYLRTQQTAQPLIDRFPSTPTIQWDIHEFTFLAEEHYRGTREMDRMGAVRKYWANCVPDHRDGVGAESFGDFMVRVDAMKERISRVDRPFTAVFSHGYVIKALLWRMLFSDHTEAISLMAGFGAAYRNLTVRNAAVYPIQVADDGRLFVGTPWTPYDQVVPETFVQ